MPTQPASTPRAALLLAVGEAEAALEDAALVAEEAREVVKEAGLPVEEPDEGPAAADVV